MNSCLVVKDNLESLCNDLELENTITIIDDHVAKLYPQLFKVIEQKSYLTLSLKAQKSCEEYKTFSSYEKYSEMILSRGIHRQHQIIAVGGGALTDFAGFLAATLLRGLPWIAVPTTLLGMIDASIGGKTALNSQHGKNLIGAFHKPNAVYLCQDFLQTLSPEILDEGKGELLKYCYLDQAIKDTLLKNGFNQDLISLCASYKEKVVEADFKESGLRKLLNFGHSFGHCYEKIYKLPHGIAVLWGIVTIVVLEELERSELTQLVRALGLQSQKVPWEQLQIDLIFNYLKRDKKLVSAQSIDLVTIKNNKTVVETRKLHELCEKFKDKRGELERFTF